jgi:hypothetical protein
MLRPSTHRLHRWRRLKPPRGYEITDADSVRFIPSRRVCDRRVAIGAAMRVQSIKMERCTVLIDTLP